MSVYKMNCEKFVHCFSHGIVNEKLYIFIPGEAGEDIQAAFRELVCPEGPQHQVGAVDKVLSHYS